MVSTDLSATECIGVQVHMWPLAVTDCSNLTLNREGVPTGHILMICDRATAVNPLYSMYGYPAHYTDRKSGEPCMGHVF